MADININANLNTQGIMSELTAVRSQVGMALSSPTGFTAPATGLVGAGGASGFVRQMVEGFAVMPQQMAAMGMHETFTNAAMAHNPHYGTIQASSQLEQEWQVRGGGIEAAQRLRPPGVSAVDYGMAVERNFIQRHQAAEEGREIAMRATITSAAAGLAGWQAGSFLGAGLGKMVGGGVGGKIGTIGGGLVAASLAAGYFEDRFAEAEQVRGVTTELGELAGAGQDLTRLERYELGGAARKASRDLNMSVQGMGDILALAGNAGILPAGTDPNEMRSKYRALAQAIDEGASALGTSLSGATEVIKNAASRGMTAQEGIMRAAGMGGADAFNRMMAFGGQGAGVARGMGFAGSQGFGLFTAAIGQAAGAGLTGEETRIMGGKYGVAGFVGRAQMGMAQSPIGNLQLMAGMGGDALGGMFDLPGQALAAMGAGGDPLRGMAQFMVHQNEYRRNVGSKGVRAMARHQMNSMSEIASQVFGIEGMEADRMGLMMMGFDPDRAKALAGSLNARGGGGFGPVQQGRAAVAMQSAMLSRGMPEMEDAGEIESYDPFAVSRYSAFGALSGGPVGVGVAAAGALIDVGRYGVRLFGGDHPSIWADPEEQGLFYEQRRQAAYDREMAKVRERYGYIDVSAESVTMGLSADLSGVELNLGLGGRAASTTAASAVLLGAGQAAGGAGTVSFGGVTVSTKSAQRTAQAFGVRKKMSDTDRWNAMRIGRYARSSAGLEALSAAELGQGAVPSDVAGTGAAGAASVISSTAGLERVKEAKAAYGRLIAGGTLAGDDEGGGWLSSAMPSLPGMSLAADARLLREFLVDVVRVSPEGMGGRAEVLQGLFAGELTDPKEMARAMGMLETAAGSALGMDVDLTQFAGRLAIGLGAAGARHATALMGDVEYGMLKLGGVGGKDRTQLIKAMQSDERMGKIRRLVTKGGDASIKQANLLFEGVAMETAKEHGLDVTIAPPTLGESFLPRASPAELGQANIPIVVGGLLQAVGLKGTGRRLEAAGTAQAESMMVGLREEVREHRATQRKRGGRVLERAVGFGEQESAMATINEALGKTNRALKDTTNSLRNTKVMIEQFATKAGIQLPNEADTSGNNAGKD